MSTPKPDAGPHLPPPNVDDGVWTHAAEHEALTNAILRLDHIQRCGEVRRRRWATAVTYYLPVAAAWLTFDIVVGTAHPYAWWRFLGFAVAAVWWLVAVRLADRRHPMPPGVRIEVRATFDGPMSAGRWPPIFGRRRS